MKKFFLYLIVGGVILYAAGYVFYREFLPGIMANAIIDEEKPSYLPKRIQTRLDAMSVPINQGTENVIRELKKANVPMEDVYHAIDDVTEEEMDLMLEDLSEKKKITPNEAFDVLKKHIQTPFDLEQFRNTFTSNVKAGTVRQFISYARLNKQMQEVDFQTTKAVLKEILRKKEKELESKGEL